MNLDDETLLSAYLDGELEPGERLAVEAALRADPGLADRLRALSVVHELVAGLPHPPTRWDLAPAVTRRIAERPLTIVALLPSLRSQPRAVGVGLAAASLFLAMTVTVGLSLVARPGAMRHPPIAQAPAPRPSPRIVRVPEPPPPPPAAPRPTAVARTSTPVRTPSAAVETGEEAHAREQLEFRKMLDNPHLRKVFVVTDVLGGRARERVGEWVENTPRVDPRFGRAVLSQGIVIDPKHPGEATVFALVMTDQEFHQFRAEMTKTFPGRVEEDDPDPTVVTQLADVGEVSIAEGAAVAAVEPVDAPLPIAAIKGDPIPSRGDASEEDARPAPEPEPSPPSRPSRAVAALDRTHRRASSVVLVWVTSP